jgi:NADH-quinone oxidoreductase subunit N
MSMVGLYYYLRPLIAMYLRPADDNATPVPVDGIQSVTLVVLALLTILLGIAPGFLSGLL